MSKKSIFDEVIGVSFPRRDGKDKVTGKTRFGADFNLPGQLHAAVYHSPIPHGIIKKLDVSKAKALPGVRAVLTGEDNNYRFGGFIQDQPVLAMGKVLFQGEPVAAVAADSERIARAAVKLIEAEYEELPYVDSIDDAIKAEALVHESWDQFKIYGMAHPVPNTNILDRFELIHGDIEKGFAEADAIVENDFSCAMLQHTVIEPHVALADCTEDELVFYTPAQSPFSVRSMIGHALNFPLSKIRIVCTDIGGGFGCKTEPKLEPIAGLLSLATGRPVKLVYGRHEEFEATFSRAPAKIHIKTGATKDGKITAQACKIYWDTGAYGGFGPRVNYNAGYASHGPYEIPNAYTDSYCMVTNHTLGTAYRGFGVSEVANAHEMQMDDLAHAIGMDPVEFRLKNVLRDGSISVTGEKMNTCGIAECIEKAAENIGWYDTPQRWVGEDGRLHGKGMGCFIKICGTPSTTSCTVRMNEDGSVNIMSASREMGQGYRTVLPQIASSILGVDIDKITVPQVDTSITPYDKTTTSSRSTFHSGNAVLTACEEVLAQLRVHVAAKWGVRVDNVKFDNGIFTCLAKPGVSLDINDIGKSGVLHEVPPVIAVGQYGTKDIFDPVDEKTHQSRRASIVWTMGAHACEVAVDDKTGVIDIVHMAGANDVGHAINPLGCKQQIEGGFVMGAGQALMEEMIYQDGHLKNGNMVDYKVPTFMDANFKTTVSLVETAHPEGPYGAKPIGEMGVAPTAPAISNAVSAACNYRFPTIPIKAEHVLFRGKEEQA